MLINLIMAASLAVPTCAKVWHNTSVAWRTSLNLRRQAHSWGYSLTGYNGKGDTLAYMVMVDRLGSIPSRRAFQFVGRCRNEVAREVDVWGPYLYVFEAVNKKGDR